MPQLSEEQKNNLPELKKLRQGIATVVYRRCAPRPASAFAAQPQAPASLAPRAGSLDPAGAGPQCSGTPARGSACCARWALTCLGPPPLLCAGQSTTSMLLT